MSDQKSEGSIPPPIVIPATRRKVVPTWRKIIALAAGLIAIYFILSGIHSSPTFRIHHHDEHSNMSPAHIMTDSQWAVEVLATYGHKSLRGKRAEKVFL